MKTLIKLCICTSLATTLIACVSNESISTVGVEDRRLENQAVFETPSWISSPPQKSAFAYGVGSGDLWDDKADAMTRAADAARVNLISQLRVTVSGDFSSTVQERSATGKQTELVKTVQNTIRSKVPAVEIDEIKITDTFFEEKFAYALAELNRVEASSRMKGQISDLEQQVLLINDKPRSGTTLEQLRVLLPALTLFAQRERLADQLSLVSMDRKKPALSAELQQVEQSILDLFNQLRIRIGMKDQGAQDIASGVIESLTEQGMRIDQSGAYDLLVEVSASLRPVEKSGSYFVFADSRVTIKDVEQRILSTFSKQAKGVSGYPELAKAKAEQSVASMLADELASALVERID